MTPTPRFEQGGERLLAGLQLRFNAQTRTQIPQLWQRLGRDHLGRIPGQVAGATYGVCHNFSPDVEFDYLAGIEVTGANGLPPALATLRLAPRRYAVFAHADHVSKIGDLWMAIFQTWLPQSAQTFAGDPCFERYGKGFDPNTGTGGMEIWIALAG